MITTQLSEQRSGIKMNPAVILIDMQYDPIDDLFSPAGKVLISSQLEVLDYCAKNDVPVVIVEYFNKGNLTTSPVLLDKCSQVPRSRIVTKYAFDAFREGSTPDFNGVLNELDSDDLTLMGVAASMCVRTTASSAVKRGYTIGTSLDLI
ncbi:cysteine hydrolase, partial [archaeon]|nr:cysteine hydrolase [archaeon]